MEYSVLEKIKIAPRAYALTVERSAKNMNKKYTGDPTPLQKAIDQIGIAPIQAVMPNDGQVFFCEIHGHYLVPKGAEDTLCPICKTPDTDAEGTTASEVELYIDLKDATQETPVDGIRRHAQGI